MYDALSNPPVPDWNSLSGDDRVAIMRAGEMHGCQCCADNDQTFYIYEEIRKVLKARERRYFAATMAGPPEMTAIGE